MFIYSYNIAFIAIMPSFAGLWWGWIVFGIIAFIFILYYMRPKKQKSTCKKSWNEHFVDPPEYSDPKEKVDAFHEVIQKNDKSIRTKNFFLWDDGLIFCGFKLQGTDLRTANLYGAYLRDMYLRERNLDGSRKPLIFRDVEPHTAIDMSGTYLKNEISIADGADIGRVDLSGLYLRDVGLQGIDIKDILKSEESKFGDYFLHESCKEK
jgi:Pentapeptide repeats (8 copies)